MINYYVQYDIFFFSLIVSVDFGQTRSPFAAPNVNTGYSAPTLAGNDNISIFVKAM